MCKVGDIILIEHYTHEGKELGRHSFVVLSDNGGEIQGVAFDIVTLVMSSFKNDEQKKRKMSYPGNFPIVVDDVDIEAGNTRSGYIKADQFYYFSKNKTHFKVIGRINDDVFNLLIEYIEHLRDEGKAFESITDNL